MGIKFIKLLFLSFISIAAHSQDIRSGAAREFNQCVAVNKETSKNCSFGGCGSIMANCYMQNIEYISSKADTIFNSIKNTKCSKSAESANESISDIDERLKKLEPLNSTWSGFEVQREISFLRLHVMKQILDECQ